ncbi:MAG: succinate--CoA ligase subunit alpha, partial [Myxococcota bacterium]|nr:succinate--CoA ligase subunit alpha [Myxococcota bacterium]
MSIFIAQDTRLLVQGMGRMGQFHCGLSQEFGTEVVAGIAPGKAGQTLQGVPIFESARDAVRETGANASVLFVPAPFAADAVLEAVAA